MQAVLHLSQPPVSFVRRTKTLSLTWKSNAIVQTPRCTSTKTSAAVSKDTSTVDYSSMTSVFPAEACETIGGEACDVEMFPEVQLKQEPTSTTAKTNTEQVDREYLEYNSPKTVFLEEACDDLGGDFCEPEYFRPTYQQEI